MVQYAKQNKKDWEAFLSLLCFIGYENGSQFRRWPATLEDSDSTGATDTTVVKPNRAVSLHSNQVKPNNAIPVITNTPDNASVFGALAMR